MFFSTTEYYADTEKSICLSFLDENIPSYKKTNTYIHTQTFFKVWENIPPNLNLVEGVMVDSNFLLYNFLYYLGKK